MSERIDTAIYVVCDEFGITTDQLKSASHKWKYADARAVLCYVLHERWHLSLSAVGALLIRHHSTVLCAARKVKMWRENRNIFPRENYQVDRVIERITTITKHGTARTQAHE